MKISNPKCSKCCSLWSAGRMRSLRAPQVCLLEANIAPRLSCAWHWACTAVLTFSLPTFPVLSLCCTYRSQTAKLYFPLRSLNSQLLVRMLKIYLQLFCCLDRVDRQITTTKACSLLSYLPFYSSLSFNSVLPSPH